MSASERLQEARQALSTAFAALDEATSAGELESDVRAVLLQLRDDLGELQHRVTAMGAYQRAREGG